MIKLKTIKHYEDDIKDQFIIEANEPVVIEILNTEEGHGRLSARVYKADDRSKPVGMYDSEAEPAEWLYFDPTELLGTPKWRLFFIENQIAEIDYLSQSDASTRMFQGDYTHYHSHEDEGLLLEDIVKFNEHERNYPLKTALNRIFQIKTEIAKNAHP